MPGINYDDYSIFAKALSEVFVPEVVQQTDMYDTDHEFSPEFQRKMRKLLKSRSKPYYDLISTAGRRAACIGAAAVIAGGSAMSVDAVREKVINFVVRHFTEHDEIRAVPDSEVSYPETIEREYSIDVPEGFVLDKETSVRTPYYNILSYKSDGNYILFHQFTAFAFKSKIYNEKCSVEYYTDENGILYTIYHWTEKEGNLNVLWQKDNYVFQLNSDLSKEAVLEMCLNIRYKARGF